MKKLEGLKALLFDADGTLIDTYEMILQSMRYTTERCLGISLPDDELMQGVGTPLFDQFVVFCKGDEKRATELVEVYRAHMKKTHDEKIAAFKDTKQALEELLRKGYQMAVVTSKPHELAERGLSLTELLPYFAFVIAADDYQEHKPLPGPILYGCKKLDLAPKYVAYIGDSPYDIEAGNAASCSTIAALWGMFSKDTLAAKHPTTFATSLTEIAETLGVSSS